MSGKNKQTQSDLKLSLNGKKKLKIPAKNNKRWPQMPQLSAVSLSFIIVIIRTVSRQMHPNLCFYAGWLFLIKLRAPLESVTSWLLGKSKILFYSLITPRLKDFVLRAECILLTYCPQGNKWLWLWCMSILPFSTDQSEHTHYCHSCTYWLRGVFPKQFRVSRSCINQTPNYQDGPPSHFIMMKVACPVHKLAMF